MEPLIKGADLKLVATTHSMQSELTIDKNEVQTLWTDGILSDVAYVAFALKLDARQYSSLSNFDVEQFVIQWQSEWMDGNGNVKIKTLKSKAVRDAIDKLIKTERIKSEQQLSIQLIW